MNMKQKLQVLHREGSMELTRMDFRVGHQSRPKLMWYLRYVPYATGIQRSYHPKHEFKSEVVNAAYCWLRNELWAWVKHVEKENARQ